MDMVSEQLGTRCPFYLLADSREGQIKEAEVTRSARSSQPIKKAEIDQEAWLTLNSDTSRPFQKPKPGRIAVKVINHLGDDVMKVFKI